jgi:hypothetical protein
MVKGKIFICYSRRDIAIRTRIQEVLTDDIVRCGWELWSDAAIDAGTEWLETILSKLLQAQVVIPIISEDFFASQFIRERELKMLRAEQAVLPLIFSPWTFDQHPLGRFQAVNRDRPLQGATREEQSRVYSMLRSAIIDAFGHYFEFPLRELAGDVSSQLSLNAHPCPGPDESSRLWARFDEPPFNYLAREFWQGIAERFEYAFLTKPVVQRRLWTYLQATPQWTRIGASSPADPNAVLPWCVRILVEQPWESEAQAKRHFLLDGIAALLAGENGEEVAANLQEFRERLQQFRAASAV